MSTDTHVAGLMEAVEAYERALMRDDLEQLDAFTAPWSDTLSIDAGGVTAGYAAVTRRRRRLGPAAHRQVVGTHVQAIAADHAVVAVEFILDSGRRGVHTQVWQRGLDGWRVMTSQVSLGAPAIDRRVWRAVGDPLVAGSMQGSLAGVDLAVQDVLAVRGHPLGAGNPAWLADSAAEPRHARVLETLLDQGAHVRGIARCDELGFGSDGVNPHYGMPPNPRGRFRVSGGAMSGPASAVAMGQAHVGIGIDSAGGVRVPAAHLGLWGMRSTHGVLSRDGILPMAPSFDAVGWVARDVQTLSAVGAALLPVRPSPVAEIVVVDGLLKAADAEVREVIDQAVGSIERWDVELTPSDRWLHAFQTVQALERWQIFAPWLEAHPDALGDDARQRFQLASTVDGLWAERAVARAADVRDRVCEFIGERVIAMPTTATPAPFMDEVGANRVRAATARLTCLAELGGLPAVTVPLSTASGLPVGLSLMGPQGSDAVLLELAATLA